LIGGTQTVVPHAPVPAALNRKAPAAHACSVSSVGGRPGSNCSWLSLAGLLFTRRRRRAEQGRAGAAPALALLLVSACHGNKPAPAQSHAAPDPGTLTREQLKSPEACKGCHPNHYREWSSSMHAYASLDPVFVAMNKRGQRETAGKLGKFCLR